MAPFEHDVEYLVARLTRVVGAAVSVRLFENAPLIAGTGPRRKWTAYEPPTPGTPVVVFTDLGIAYPTPNVVDDWLVFSRLLRRAACPLVALVPWPKQRHPRRLSAEFPTIVWDRSTTLASLRRVNPRGRNP
jgi:hypothetical protein